MEDTMEIKINGENLVQVIKNGEYVRSGRFYLCVCGAIIFHRFSDHRPTAFERSHLIGTAHVPWMNGATGWVLIPRLGGDVVDREAEAYQLAKDLRHRLNMVELGHPINGWYPRGGIRYEWVDHPGTAKRVSAAKRRGRRALVLMWLGRLAGPTVTLSSATTTILIKLLDYFLTPLEEAALLVPRLEEALVSRWLGMGPDESVAAGRRTVTKTRIRAIEIVRHEVRDE